MRPVYQGSKNIVSIHLCSRRYIFLKATLTLISSFISIYLLIFWQMGEGKSADILIGLSPTIKRSFTETFPISWLLGMWSYLCSVKTNTSQSCTLGGSYRLPRSSNLPSISHRNSSCSYLFSLTSQILQPFSLSQSNSIKEIRVTPAYLEPWLINSKLY